MKSVYTSRIQRTLYYLLSFILLLFHNMIYFSSKILKLFIFLFRITRFPRLLLYSFPSERIKKKKRKKSKSRRVENLACSTIIKNLTWENERMHTPKNVSLSHRKLYTGCKVATGKYVVRNGRKMVRSLNDRRLHERNKNGRGLNMKIMKRKPARDYLSRKKREREREWLKTRYAKFIAFDMTQLIIIYRGA